MGSLVIPAPIREQQHIDTDWTLFLSVMSYLVVLQIPTLDLLVFSTGEQVRAATADGHAAHGADVSRQGELQFPSEKVPDLSRQNRHVIMRWQEKHSLNIQLPQIVKKAIIFL